MTVKVLHIEDNSHDAMLMQALLASNSDSGEYQVVHVNDIREALRGVRSDGYNAVLLDLDFKKSNALDNLRAIRGENPNIPVIVLKGMGGDDIALRALEEGAQECLDKCHSDGKVLEFALKSSMRRKNTEQTQCAKSNYDDMTGLPNGRLFHEHLQHAMQRADRWQRKLAVMFVDVYGIENMADEHGEDAAQKATMEAAYRMSTTLRNTDILARYSGDQFLVLLDDHSKYMERATKLIINKLQKSLDESYTYKDQELELAASISVAIFENGEWRYQPSSTSRFIAAGRHVHPVLDPTLYTRRM
ncbi:MAG: diguanylate cyclase [Rickettsiales bacterium]|nr:diguanylate cyclase [Rickettsiales bacterium]